MDWKPGHRNHVFLCPSHNMLQPSPNQCCVKALAKAFGEIFQPEKKTGDNVEGKEAGNQENCKTCKTNKSGYSESSQRTIRSSALASRIPECLLFFFGFHSRSQNHHKPDQVVFPFRNLPKGSTALPKRPTQMQGHLFHIHKWQRYVRCRLWFCMGYPHWEAVPSTEISHLS